MHELRATVNGVTLCQRVLTGRRTRLSRKTRSRLEHLHETELARLERLVVDGPQAAIAPVDLAEVLDPLVDAVRLRGHAVLWTGTRHQALGRRDDIAEIAHILLDNAVRHAGGRDVAVEVTARAGRVEVRVRDHGPGVSPALAPAVFDRGTRTTTSRGEGIGLHIARRLAHDLDGDLRLAPTAPASGAEFVLELPESTGDVQCLAAAV
jgi:signal transduction histidine kinase